MLRGRFADLESACAVDFCDDVIRRVVDVVVVLEPRHGRRRDAGHVTLEHELRAFGHVRRLEVLGEVRWCDLLVRLCGGSEGLASYCLQQEDTIA